MKEYTAAYRRRHKALGLCCWCSNPTYLGGVYCYACFSKRPDINKGNQILNRMRWKRVNWEKWDDERIMKYVGVTTLAAVRYQRKKYEKAKSSFA